MFAKPLSALAGMTVLAGCATVSRDETESTSGPHRVAVARTVFTAAMPPGWHAEPRETILRQGEELELTSSDGSLARVQLQDGRKGTLFRRDLEPAPPSPAAEMRQDLRRSHHTTSPGEVEDPPPARPVQRRLIEEANDLDMPAINPLLSSPS